MKTGRTIRSLAEEIHRRATSKHDVVWPAKSLNMVEAIYPPKKEGGAPQLDVHLDIASREDYPIGDIAHGQLATYTGIPAKYYDRMRQNDPGLLAKNVNRWMHDTGDNRLVRVLDGRMRAFLSDKFRPMENEDLAENILPVIQAEIGLENVMSCEITERRLYIKIVDPRVTRELKIRGAHWGDGKHNIINTVAPALTISNSEVGMGRLSVLAGYYNGFCTNLATFGERSVRKSHIGARHEIVSDEMFTKLSPEARAAADKALWLQLVDVVKNAFDPASFHELIDKVEGTQNDKIEGDVGKVVQLASKRFGATEEEGKGILRHLIEGGSLTRFGLHNAITRTAQDLDSYDRATEFEEIGGKLIELPRSEWNSLALAA